MQRSDRKQRRGTRHGWLELSAALLCMVPALAQAKAERPDPLKSEAGCDHYRGVPIGANDSTQQFELMVCTTAEGVKAKVQTSSLVSGWSVRQSVGSWDASGKVLTLQETHFIESKPEPGWRFCLIDSIVLEKTTEGLSGTYVSEACTDQAQLELVKLGPPPGTTEPANGTGDERRTAETPPHVPEREPEKTEPEQKPGGCSCDVSGSTLPPGLALVALFGLALVTGRRRGRPTLR
jgi:MYXO-CTERM domain-containing protein